MNRHAITLSQAFEGYFVYAQARRLSPNTLDNYAYVFRKLATYLPDDPPLTSITPATIRGFLNAQHLSKKTLLNLHAGLSALWRWAEHEKLVECNILRDVEPPKPEEREIVPLTQADVKALLAACDRTRAYDRPGKRRCDNTRPTGLRDRAILLLLIDTGLRASELCELRIHQADLKNHRVTVMGKGSKERLVPMSPRTAQSLWRYLATRPDAKPVNYLFITGQDTPFDRTSLRRLVYRIGERAGVNNVHPHRFRHTFAIQCLRNGCNVYALQRLLGHTTLDMVKRYLAIAQTDVENAHRDASPVTNWCL